MKELTVKIIDPIGLHARPASLMVTVASKFSSDITIHEGTREGNLKSIMNIMALGIKKDVTITIRCKGSDENEAIEAIKKVMVKNKLI